MRTAISCIFSVLFAIPTDAQERLPIIDMHAHALAADHQGPPPLAMCTPITQFPAWDPVQPYGKRFMAMLKDPLCKDPVWSPMTDEALMTETINVMEHLNIVGVLSGTPERVATWMKAAPERFYPGLHFQIGAETPTPDALQQVSAQSSRRFMNSPG